jgi:hypothetical protein
MAVGSHIGKLFTVSEPHPSQPQGGYSLQTQETKQDRYRRERDEADEEVRRLLKEVDKLKADLKRQEEVVSQTKESTTRVRQAMQDKELFIGPQALDREVLAHFTSLFKNVRSWTRHFGGGKDLHLEAIDKDTLKQFNTIAPGLNAMQLGKIFSSKNKTRYFLQGWVSLMIIENLIPTPDDEPYKATLTRDLWMEQDDAQSLFTLERALSAKSKDHKRITP